MMLLCCRSRQSPTEQWCLCCWMLMFVGSEHSLESKCIYMVFLFPVLCKGEAEMSFWFIAVGDEYLQYSHINIFYTIRVCVGLILGAGTAQCYVQIKVAEGCTHFLLN